MNNTNDLLKLLAEKDELIQELRNELEETNKGILHLVMELESTAELQQQYEDEKLEELQNELAESDQGLFALATELELAKEKYRNILEHAKEAIITFDTALKIETFNKATEGLFGFSQAELEQLSVNQLIPQFKNFFNASNKLGRLPHSFLRTKHQDDYELLAKHKNGVLFPIEITLGSPFYQEKKTWMMIARDITERKQTEQKLKLMAKIFQDSCDAIIITDTEGVVVEVNAAFTQITGYEDKEVIGKFTYFVQTYVHKEKFYRSIWESLKTHDTWSGEIWDKKKDGNIYPKWLVVSSLKDHKKHTSHYIGVFNDISHRKEVENKLLQLAHFDQLTGLPNRALFLDRLRLYLELANKNNRKIALMFLDLDRFKNINDTLGHHVGDQLLVEVAERLKKTIGPKDFVARLAGDEFTILLNNANYKKQIRTTANNILRFLVEPFYLADREIFISGSVGIALFPDDAWDSHNLLKNADIAMYHAKAKGKNTFSFYSGGMIAHLNDELELENNIRKALTNGEFSLVYQPQINLKNEEIVGVEALIRWQHPSLGLISPSLFINIAEQTGLIVHVGDWVLKTACQHYVEWQNAGLKPIKMSVNYSGVQLRQVNQIENITAILNETGMDPNNLCLEMTETVAMEDAENTIKTLRSFKSMGLSISIDDFGTGYSSLSYLKRFPIDMLKIDRSFIKDLTEKPDESAIASTIIAMAHKLHLSVIAEGVETNEQLKFIKNEGCDFVQGFYLCHPLPSNELLQFIAQRKH